MSQRYRLTARHMTTVLTRGMTAPVTPEARLVVAIVVQAMLDVLDQHRAANDFLRAPMCRHYCDMVGLQLELVQLVLARARG